MLAAATLHKAASGRNNADHNFQIVAVDISQRALEKAKTLGATHAVHVQSKRDKPQQVAMNVIQMLKDDYIKTNLGNIDAITVSRIVDGVDLTIDAAGFSDTSEAAVWATRPGGRMVQVGLPSQPVPINMTRIAGKEITIVGSHGFDGANDLPKLLEMVEEANYITAERGKNNRMHSEVSAGSDPPILLDPCQLVEAEVTLEQGCQALQDMDKQSPLGIVMITKFRNDGDSHPSKM